MKTNPRETASRAHFSNKSHKFEHKFQTNAARDRVLCLKMLVEVVSIAKVRQIICKHCWWSDTPWAKGWRSSQRDFWIIILFRHEVCGFVQLKLLRTCVSQKKKEGTPQAGKPRATSSPGLWPWWWLMVFGYQWWIRSKNWWLNDVAHSIMSLWGHVF